MKLEGSKYPKREFFFRFVYPCLLDRMEDKGKGVVGEDEEKSFSVLEGGPSNVEVDGGDGSGDNYDDDDDEDENSDEGGQVHDDDDEGEGDESEEEEGDDSEAGSGIPTTLERLEYGALAEKKRKALADSRRLVFFSLILFICV